MSGDGVMQRGKGEGCSEGTARDSHSGRNECWEGVARERRMRIGRGAQKIDGRGKIREREGCLDRREMRGGDGWQGNKPRRLVALTLGVAAVLLHAAVSSCCATHAVKGGVEWRARRGTGCVWADRGSCRGV